MTRARNWKRIFILSFSFLLLCCSRAQGQSITNMTPTSGPVGSPVTLTGTGFGASQGSSTLTLGSPNAVATSWSDTAIVAVVPAGASTGTFTLTLNGQQANSSTFTVTTLPSGWTDQDIGSVGLAGSATYATGVFTVSGAGHGMMSYTTDGFHFDYQALSGDGTILARVVSKSYNYAQAGVMIRETLDAGAKSMFVGSYGGVIYTFARTASGGTPVSTAGSVSAPLPYWVKLVRSGSSFTGTSRLMA